MVTYLASVINFNQGRKGAPTAAIRHERLGGFGNVSFDFDRLGTLADLRGIVSRLHSQQVINVRAECFMNAQRHLGGHCRLAVD